jgi:sulfatase maturation enzyme AslB (radical SAM superfamily)
MGIEITQIGNQENRLGFYNPLNGSFSMEQVMDQPKSLEIIQTFPETELYIELTESCNLKCQGCAVGSERIASKDALLMEEDVLWSVLEGTFRSVEEIRQSDPSRNKIKIKYAGGEPLLPKAFKLVEGAQEMISTLQGKYPEIEFRQVVLTNGVLINDEIVKKLKEWDMSVSVSLWGLGDENDKARGMRQGFDSASKVLNGIKKLTEADIRFNVNHVVSPANADKLKDFVSSMWDITSESFIGKDWSFPNRKRPIPVAIQFLRPQTLSQMEMLEDTGGAERMIKGIREMFDVAVSLTRKGINIPGLKKLDYLQPFDGVTAFTCGSGINYVAAGPKGIANCHEGLYMMDPNLHELNSGQNLLNIVNAPYANNIGDIAGISRDYSNIDPSLQLALALHGGGGCPRVEQLSGGANLGTKSNLFTKRIYAEILPTFLAFEAERRILNQHD